MNLNSSSLKRSVMIAIFGAAVLAFGSIAANAQHRDGGYYGRQNVRSHRHYDGCGHDRVRRAPVYYGNNGYYDNGYYDNGYYGNSGYYSRRPVYRRSSRGIGIGNILRVFGGGRGRHGRRH